MLYAFWNEVFNGSALLYSPFGFQEEKLREGKAQITLQLKKITEIKYKRTNSGLK